LFFVVTQLVAALFTPRPLVSLGLAALRCLFFLGMVAAGAYLKDGKRLRPLVWGYLFTFAVAWGFELASHGTARVMEGRLGHPFYYTVSLGIISTITIWILVAWKGAAPWWRFAIGALALVTLIATGSRGPLLALAVGALAAVLLGNLRYLRALAVGAVVVVGAFGLLPGLRSVIPLERFASSDLSGREQVWQGAAQAFADSPIGGQGTYQIGEYLWFLYKDPCRVTVALMEAGVGCPAWLDQFKGAWLTAHNVVLHSLAETGLVGTVGLLVVFLATALAVWRTRDGLLVSLFWGFMALSLVEVVTTGPSPHFAELFWVVVGMAFARGLRPDGVSNDPTASAKTERPGSLPAAPRG